MSYITKKVDIDFYDLDENIEVTLENCNVTWHAEVEEKSWGISTISHYIDAIDVEVTWDYIEENLPTTLLKEFRDTDGFFNFAALADGEWDITSDMTMEDDGQLCPANVEVHWKEKKIIVS